MNNFWADSLDIIKPYVFKIYTSFGSGTGFQLRYSREGNFIAVATAFHVIEGVVNTSEQIVFVDENNKVSREIDATHWEIMGIPEYDLAVIMMNADDFAHMPQTNTPISNLDTPVRAGVQMGWCGYPTVAEDHMCFFTGYTSSWLPGNRAYLVDGVAVSGLSGSPAFILGNNGPEICGVVTAYAPNDGEYEMLGVGQISSVSSFLPFLKELALLDEQAYRS